LAYQAILDKQRYQYENFKKVHTTSSLDDIIEFMKKEYDYHRSQDNRDKNQHKKSKDKKNHKNGLNHPIVGKSSS